MKRLIKDDEVFIEEVFNAGIERVFRAWTDPAILMKWYAPEGCTIRFKKLEIKTGGKFHSCISNPKYGDCWCIGEYKELVPNERIVFTMLNTNEHGDPVTPVEIGMDAEWPVSTLVTVTLKEEDGRTRLQLRQTVVQELAFKTGAYGGWLQMLENLQITLNQNL